MFEAIDVKRVRSVVRRSRSPQDAAGNASSPALRSQPADQAAVLTILLERGDQRVAILPHSGYNAASYRRSIHDPMS
ncbi:protein of unknown function [Candidatus Nitrospira inopinata]|uniref:Uncharacterized protein n=1 Tax=Candidatus Nitrospira inopinata TaxID=1715989 RepID=A0A0S4KQ81_9BACT|nr:protein of unknown function [Candidatus Nitrospira inopinata]